MEAWLKSALESGYIVKVDSTEVQHGVYCEASPSPWYDDGVVFDWATLHQRLVQSASTQPYVETYVSALAQFGAGAAADAARSGKECYATVVELKAPWSLQPLSEQAQNLSVFDVPAAKAAASTGTDGSNSGTAAAAAGPLASSPLSGHSRDFYKFIRGPPGQRAVRDDMTRVLRSVQEQLRQNKIQVFCFLSSFVIVCEDFTELLHRTAAVFQALTDGGFTVDGHGSALGPRVVQRLRVGGGDWWTTLQLHKITAEADVVSLLVALFFQWLLDAYVWSCVSPLRLFPDAREKGAEEQAKGVRLFEKFVRGLVLPSIHAIGLAALTATLPEEGGNLLELAAVKLERKLPPVGPQRWSVLELRLVLCQINAYHHLPSEYLGRVETATATLSAATQTKK
ncbi:hypothetical protein ABB37_04365 [Leptomonas pyrrhocoris]|uniref:Uncharacterized protein n=1 Tax=Leptomonas pyrrhocoris TaxID=157538 RepID=A0A0N1J4W0_LEPPY|nr:hypothetical protein ABB37_04365 [Leptomonas pyrrhocoris]KPA80978.1 hypothetical protein ABB37_04365 [Leptomonas pyrrhocoris]|eukprot:XP_015659417.1 hypothetical protein ABB37_04365 [Leptomonas pyrrhocoris]